MNAKSRPVAVMFLMLAAIGPFASSARAQVSTWQAIGLGLWSNPLNWSNGVPNSSTSIAQLSSEDSGTVNVLVDVPVLLNTLEFGASQSSSVLSDVAFTFSGVESQPTIRVDENAGSISFDAPIELQDAAELEIAIATGNQLTFGSTFESTPTNIRVVDSGEVVLRSANVNWGGAAYVDQGTFVVQHPQALGTGSRSEGAGTVIGPNGRLRTTGTGFTIEDEYFDFAGGSIEVANFGSLVLDGDVLVSQPSRISIPNSTGSLRLEGRLQGSEPLVLETGVLIFDGASTSTSQLQVSGGRLEVESIFRGTIEAVGGRTILRRPSSTSGAVMIDGGRVELDFQRSAAWGGPFSLHDGDLRVISADATIEKLQLEDANTGSVVVSSARTLQVQGPLSGPGALNAALSGQFEINGAEAGVGNVSIQGSGTTVLRGRWETENAFQLNGGTLSLMAQGSTPLVLGRNTDLSISQGGYSGPITIRDGVKVRTTNRVALDSDMQIEGLATFELERDQSIRLAGVVRGPGSLEVQGGRGPTNLAIDGGVSIDGGFTLRGDGSFDTATIGGISANDVEVVEARLNVAANLNVANASVDLGQLTFDGAESNIEGRLAAYQSQLEINSPVFVGLLESDRSTLRGTGSLAAERLDLYGGSVELSSVGVVGNTLVRKVGANSAFIQSLGTGFTGTVNVERGPVVLGGATALGQGAIRITGPNASIEIRDVHEADFDLNNSRGGLRSTALRGFRGGVLEGNLNLGSEGSVLGDGRIDVRGQIHGGSLEVNARVFRANVLVRSAGHTYSGETNIYGLVGPEGVLSVLDQGRIESTAGVRLHYNGRLELYGRSEQGPFTDRLADSIPITMLGGELFVESNSPDQTPLEGEKLGIVGVERGTNRLRFIGESVTHSLADLQVAPNAVVRISPGEKLTIDAFEDRSFLGANVVVLDERSLDVRFASYSDTAGITSLSVEKQTGPPLIWLPDDHVETESGGSLNESKQIRSLRFFSDNERNLAINNATLNIQSGGVILDNAVINGENGSLTAGGDQPNPHLIVHAGRRPGRVNVSIVDNPGRDGERSADPDDAVNADNGHLNLVKSGTARLTLAGPLEYSGDTIVTEGELRLEDEALNLDGRLIVDGGALSLPPDATATMDTFELRNGSTSGHPTSLLGSPAVTLEKGIFSIQVVGETEIRKTSPGEVSWQVNNPELTGTVHISNGVLLASQRAFGDAIVYVEPEGALVSDGILQLSADLVLRGGRMTAARFERFENSESKIVFEQDTLLEMVEDVGSSYASFKLPVVLHDGVTVSFERSSMASFSEGIEMRDRSKLLLGSGDVDLLIRGSALKVGAETVIEVLGLSAEPFYEMGPTVMPLSANSSLDFRGTRLPQGTVSVQLLENRTLALLRESVIYEINVEGDEQFVTGSGRLANPLAVGDGAILAPGDNVGQMTIGGDVVINDDAALTWHFFDANADVGDGWSYLFVEGSLRTSSSARGIDMTLLPQVVDGNPQPVRNFDPRTGRTWVIAEALDLVGFRPADVRIDPEAFTVDRPLPRSGEFGLEVTDNAVHLIYQVLFGDLDQDGTLDTGDIDQLMSRLRTNSRDLSYDIDLDGQLSTSDLDRLVHDVFGTYFGDANLDGEFNSEDLVGVFAAGEYEDDRTRNSQWATGDWNGDREFTSTDLVRVFQDGGYEQGPRVALGVPEPTGAFGLALGLVFLSYHRRDFF